MAQTVVPAFYSTRKRFKEPIKHLKEDEKQKFSDVVKESETSSLKTTTSVKKTTKNKTRGKKVNKVTDYFKSKAETSKESSKKDVPTHENETLRTPTKRNLSTPEEITPSKKKIVSLEEPCSSKYSSVEKTPRTITPKKLQAPVCRKLSLSSPLRYGSPKKFGSPVKVSPQKAAVYENLTNHDLASIVNESRSRLLFSGRLDDLKKSLEKFSNDASITKEFQSNSHKITSVVAQAKTSDQERKPPIQGELSKKFSIIASDQTESALVLPLKYKLLAEAFRCLDVVVQILNNRKEIITFEKVQKSVQKMMNKNFEMNHLGQILSVLPTAYHLVYEKIISYTVNKGSSPYHLVITPCLNNVEGKDGTSKGRKKNLEQPFVYMTSQHLLERKNIFSHNLLETVKKHHQNFLKRMNFPPVSDDKIVRWHPKFQDGNIPDIPAASLPEVPETKIATAKDVFNKIKGSARGRVEKAMQSVIDELNVSKEKSTPESAKKTSTKKPNAALKGICTDLLEKIRAKESAKLLETMTRSVKDEKRLAMMEKVPKIANILWHYFIAERKSAVPVDAAIEKIRHSLDSLSSPDEIKAHLQLVMEVMPGWLSLIKVSKGEYLTMDKKRDINVMLDKIK